jgi:hypothetical protein
VDDEATALPLEAVFDIRAVVYEMIERYRERIRSRRDAGDQPA